MGQYPYKPLNLPHETRILTVMPGSGNDQLICSLSHLQINSPGDYDALSYCWSKSISNPPPIDFNKEYPVALSGEGINEVRQVKLCDGLDDPILGGLYIRLGGVLPPEEALCDGMSIKIGGELSRALRRMREEKEPLRIWVDALCINQDDVQERNEHVKMMDTIYARAENVRVWLGEEIGLEMAAAMAFSKISAALSDAYVPDQDLADTARRFRDHPDFNNIPWRELGDFLRRAWFERSWIIQEIVNAKSVTVHTGCLSFPWDSIYFPIATLRKLRIDSVLSNPRCVKAIIMLGDLREERKTSHGAPLGQPLLGLLEELRHFESTIAADKIYAILGLVSTEDEIPVDYSKPSEQVFTEFAAQQLRAGSLDILTHCVFSPQPGTLVGLPSWVPDWTRPGAVEPFRIRGLLVSTAGSTKPQVTSIDETSGTIKLKGRLLDTVDSIDEVRQIAWEDADYIVKEQGFCIPPERSIWQDELNRLRLKESTENIMTNIAFPGHRCSREQYEAAWRTFMCNRTRENEVPDAGYGHAWGHLMMYCPESSNEGLSKSCVSTETEKKDAEMEQRLVDKMLYTFIGAHGKWCYHRRFYRSMAGRYGWAVDGTKHGDVVALFYGCSYPFILRPQGSNRYRIIGDCYIHGLMDGEGLGNGYTEEEFTIV
ncbi:hypothetical protein GQ53DRAFT_864260 [Thozetella sp. PMI_491]|nr:hypothetical protein GQ53DRAFT_864260 [Thozetella sp. PMI_491]